MRSRSNFFFFSPNMSIIVYKEQILFAVSQASLLPFKG